MGPALSFIMWLFVNMHAQPLLTGNNPDTFCTAFAVFTEARGESWDGQVSVAQVVKNRTRYADSACEVVFEPHQFSGVHRWPVGVKPWGAEPKAWIRAVIVAQAVLTESYTHKPTANALYFHEKRINPRWSPKLKRVATVGNHIFYEDKR